MNCLCYMVTATLPDERTADEYVGWLESGHIQQVIDAGAQSGAIVRLDPDATGKPRVMSQYAFATRQAFDLYCERHAPALRADGLAKFPPSRGIRFERRVGLIVGSW